MTQFSVGLIRPPETAASAAFRELIIDEADDELAENLRNDPGPRFDETADKLLTELREMIEEVAERIHIRIRLYEYQAHEIRGQDVMLGRKRLRDFLQNDLLVALDPNESQCAAMMEGTSVNPVQRVAVAFSSREDLYAKGRFLAAKKLPVIDGKRDDAHEALLRCFSLHLSPNDDQRSQDYADSLSVVGKALCYPHAPPVPVERKHFTSLYIPG